MIKKVQKFDENLEAVAAVFVSLSTYSMVLLAIVIIGLLIVIVQVRILNVLVVKSEIEMVVG